MKIFITGANGFVGYYLAQELLKRNHTVVATGRGSCRLPFDSSLFIYESLDFTNDEQVQLSINNHQPSVIVHCGAMSKPDECEQNREAAFRTNVTGTVLLLNAASRFNCFFIFLSTDFVFDGNKGMYNEKDPVGPVNYYGLTKVLAEEEVKKYTGNWSIVRTVLVYGKPSLNRQNLLTNTAMALNRGEKLRIFNDQVRTPTYVEDLASALATIIDRKANGIFHISGKDVLTPYLMAIATANYLKLDASLIESVSENEFDQPARRPLKTGFDISRARNELNFEPTGFMEGLEKTFKGGFWEHGL